MGKLAVLVFISLGLVSCTQDLSFSTIDLSEEQGLAVENHTWVDQAQKVDVLVVVDNSSSMAREQRKLGARIKNFLGKISDVQWHLGITTTDVSGGRYGLKGELLKLNGTEGKVLSPEVPGYERVFEKNIRREESEDCFSSCPSNSEQPLMATAMAVEKHQGVNKSFFRPEAQLAVIIITDEDEKSNGPSSAMKPRAVLEKVRRHLGLKKVFTVYGIIVEPDDFTCLKLQDRQSSAHYGHHIAQLAELTGGLTGSICDNDYSSVLGAIGQDTSTKLRHLVLRHRPVPETVEVHFEPAHETSFEIEGRSLRFAEAPPHGTQILIRYQQQN